MCTKNFNRCNSLNTLNSFLCTYFYISEMHSLHGSQLLTKYLVNILNLNYAHHTSLADQFIKIEFLPSQQHQPHTAKSPSARDHPFRMSANFSLTPPFRSAKNLVDRLFYFKNVSQHIKKFFLFWMPINMYLDSRKTGMQNQKVSILLC